MARAWELRYGRPTDDRRHGFIKKHYAKGKGLVGRKRFGWWLRLGLAVKRWDGMRWCLSFFEELVFVQGTGWALGCVAWERVGFRFSEGAQKWRGQKLGCLFYPWIVCILTVACERSV